MGALKDEAQGVYENIRALEREILTRVNASCADSDDNTREDGVGRAREDVHALRKMIDELKEIAEEAVDSEREEITHMVRERELGLESTRSIIRHAAVEAAARERKREDLEREELLMARDGKTKLDDIKGQGAVAMSNEATEGLRRARQLMATELEKGERTLAAMTESTATMEKTGTEYSNQTTKLSSGRKLITTIERQTFMDRIILWTGFTIFMLVVIHILWKRTPMLARFHPMYRSAATTKEVDSASESVPDNIHVTDIGVETSLADVNLEDFNADSAMGADDPYKIPEATTRDEL
jgi:protein transport protein SEC20